MGYMTDGRSRASRRRSRWNLLLIPCYILPWLLLWFGSALVFGRLYALIHASTRVRVLPDTIGGILIAVGALFAWLGPSMIIANQLVAAVPVARRALDQEATAVPGSDRQSANRALLRMSRVLVPVGFLVALAGVLLPW
jgi:hypothetical protein